MTEVTNRYIQALISDIFGDVVGNVAFDLVSKGACTLNMVSKCMPSSKVKESLQVLIQHNLVTFKKSRGHAFYSFDCDYAVSIMRFPKYLYIVKNELGDDAEIILEAFLQCGRLTVTSALYKAACKLQETSEDSSVFIPMLKKKFDLLCANKFIRRLPQAQPGAVPQFSASNQMFESECIDVDELQKNVVNKTKLNEKQDTGNVYYRVNQDRFHEYMRDQLIADAVSRRIDDKAGIIMKILLQKISERYNAWEATSGSITFNSVMDSLNKKKIEIIKSDVTDYMKLLEDDPASFITKVGEEGGGSYAVNIMNIVTQLTWATVDHVVQEKYGSKAARIFRLIRCESYVEQDHIQKKAMLLDKEAKHLTYTLLENNFLQLKEIRKSVATAGPVKNFYLFYINLSLTVRTLLHLCYKGLGNLIDRNNDELNDNKRVIEKQQRTETILQNLKDQGATEDQLQEVEELITPGEKQILDHVQQSVHKLSLAELQLDETAFLFQTYLFFDQMQK